MRESGVGDVFQRSTKYSRGSLPGGGLDWANRPDTLKIYTSAPRITLSTPETTNGAPAWDIIQQRRSIRRFGDTPLQENELSQLLWATQGVTRTTRDIGFRTAPSAGALYPIETYAIIHSVETVDPGVYHYAIGSHDLEQLRLGDFRAAVTHAVLDQSFAHSASVVLIWTAVLPRSKWKYRQRAYRYVYLDVGHIAQNTALAAVALGLGSCQIGAFYDDEANALLGVDGTDETAIYATAVGRPKK